MATDSPVSSSSPVSNTLPNPKDTPMKGGGGAESRSTPGPWSPLHRSSAKRRRKGKKSKIIMKKKLVTEFK